AVVVAASGVVPGGGDGIADLEGSTGAVRAGDADVSVRHDRRRGRRENRTFSGGQPSRGGAKVERLGAGAKVGVGDLQVREGGYAAGRRERHRGRADVLVAVNG